MVPSYGPANGGPSRLAPSIPFKNPRARPAEPLKIEGKGPGLTLDLQEPKHPKNLKLATFGDFLGFRV